MNYNYFLCKKRAQTSTEYLITASIVLLVAVIVVAAIGGIPWIGGNADVRVSKAYWSSADIGLTTWSIDSAGNVVLNVMNNNPQPITITKIEFGNKTVWSGNYPLSIGGKGAITGSLGEALSDDFSYDVRITYRDIKTGGTYEFTGKKKIVGTVANTNLGGNGSNESNQAGSYSWVLDSEAEFDTGSFTNTYSNGDQVELSGALAGSYLNTNDSNATSTSWLNISFGEALPYGEELPNNAGSDAGADMSGNILLMHMNEQSAGQGPSGSDVEDFSGSANHGDAFGSIGFGAQGKLGTALDFSGSDVYVKVLDSASFATLTTNATVSFWIKPNDLATDQRVFFKKNNIEVKIKNNEIECKFKNDVSGDVKPKAPLSSTDWVFVACTVSSAGEGIIYINGTQKGTSSKSGFAFKQSNDPLYIGIKDDMSKDYSGLIDELAIWNRTLQGSEALSIYKRAIMNLTLQYRSCDDPLCDTEPWAGSLTNSSLKTLTGVTGRYFQINASLTTQDPSYSPILLNVSVGFHVS
ncbi:LamG domain-containing protein [Candidatus Woesearchaeota archaeon]|nr:MAG: LamG domain-containing protein [Candidatus Woesearchaeota archaeon]